MPHAIAECRITCAAMGCHQPGTVIVVCTQLPKMIRSGDGRDRWIEATPVELEFCERCAAKLRI